MVSETPGRVIELKRGEAEIEEKSIDLPHPRLSEDPIYIGKTAVIKCKMPAEARQSNSGYIYCCVISIDPYYVTFWCDSF